VPLLPTVGCKNNCFTYVAYSAEFHFFNSLELLTYFVTKTPSIFFDNYKNRKTRNMISSDSEKIAQLESLVLKLVDQVNVLTDHRMLAGN
jgi:hypothetical protein